MFLKSIELFGFKSFPDRTKIDFENHGIAVVLGPNGCGKSNIVDAVKWVIGEQSTKTLRATKMEDVIFNGTENRKALNVAEVTLHLSNENNVLPLDVPEISIKRRLYRSGESEYFLNKNPVRLKEIRTLFYDTGIGTSAYSIMEQGEIDQILSSKPEERRLIFEEAAGITRYKAKAQEAERKLERTEENMRQVAGILGEVKRSYDTLEAQSRKTLVYRGLREKLFDDDLNIQLINLKEYLRRRNRREQSLKSLTEKRDAVQSGIAAINAVMEKSIDQVNSMESRLIDTQKSLYGAELEQKNRESQIRIFNERIAEHEKKIRETEAREQRILDKLANLKNDIANRSASLEKLIAETGEIIRNIEGFQRDLNHFTVQIKANNARITANEQSIVALERDVNDLRVDLRKITDDIVTQLDQRLKEIGYSYSHRRKLEQDIEQLITAFQIRFRGKSAIIDDIRSLSTKNSQDVQKIIQDVGSLLSDTSQEIERLSELFNRYKQSTPSFLDEFLAPEGIITRKRNIDERINRAYARMIGLRSDNDGLKKHNASLEHKIEEYRKTLENLRVNRARMEAQRTSLQDEVARLEGDIGEQESLLKRNREEKREGRRNIREISARIQGLKEELSSLSRQEQMLRKTAGKLESDIRQKNESLQKEEKSLESKMAKLANLQGLVEKRQVEIAEIKTEIKNIYSNFQDKHSRELEEFESRMFDIKASAGEIRQQLAVHREELKKLGHVNLMAPEEFLEVKERYQFLQTQVDDLRKAREDLGRISAEIREESSELFLATYNTIKRNFHVMLRRLFGGGRAELRLLDPDDVLGSGIGIYAQPPGKKLENINLLSGGERSLTGVALLFATFLAKPAPFCILDEIDAALDETNIGRFVGLLKEFSQKTQFIIISHNKRTILGAETLLGITMEESGVSKIIATRVRDYAKRA